MTIGRRNASASMEDYLAAIYSLTRGERPVIAARLAEQVGVSLPAASEAIQRLARRGYVQVGPGRRLLLTAGGREIAAAIIRRRRLLKRWLTGTLGVDETEAQETAHRLEHVLSSRVERLLATSLGMSEPLSAGIDPGDVTREGRHES
jgi:DtxR family Mn-dependent transcriptional regulator